MNYFIMVGEGEHPVHPIRTTPDLPGGPWYHGKKLKITVPSPLDYMLAPNYEEDCKVKAMYGNKSIPVMHDDLVNVLLSVGVNNLELFPARLINPDTGVIHENYKAFNIIGLISAVDMKSSIVMNPEESPILGNDFESLVIDTEKAQSQELHIFRLAESCNAICVSDQVRKAVEESAIPGIIFYEQGEWSG